eukprot:CAMPEP_0201583648 /NCGR_PEP_ID=MMETSP0190_2-20130828/100918_1 /ASSEMBLY_ACC=CAM_ASM_000263 /TAXON_ID=37353 /ORGANISM="Rosalina sp." /LENGTH=435 /DNA_ID=CAMNT_0048025951 /DNA_START=57 /DNA_END=1361 /DNA_ORIENTATION=-
MANPGKNDDAGNTTASSKQVLSRKSYIGKTNNIEQELKRLQTTEYVKDYKPLIEREIVQVIGADNNANDNELESKNNDKDESDNKDDKISFNMMTFNTLADGLSGAHVQSKTFVHADNACLEYEYRGFRLIEEITRFMPDVITCQEVDRIEFFKHYLSPFGYKYIHTTKPQSACCRIGKGVNLDLPPDGSVVFWNSKVFALVKSYKFSKRDDRNAPKEIRNLACAVAHLRHKQNKNKEIMIAATHLKADYSLKSEKQRLMQLCYLFPSLQKLSKENNNVPLFIGLDFNAMDKSLGSFFPYSYQSLMNGKYLLKRLNKFVNKEDDNIETEEKDDNELNDGEKNIKAYNFGDDEDMAKTVIDILKERGYEYNYGLDLKSAYCYGEYKGKKKGINPSFTCTLGGQHCIDFIFFEPKKDIKITHLLTTPKAQEMYKPDW